jgi:Protein of unknown function (DUF1579)
MEMPRPGDAHKKLAALVGEWAGEETLHPSPWDPDGGGAQAQVTNRWVADGFAVVQEYEQRRSGRVTFRGHGVFWFDPVRGEYVMHWWDSMGGTAGEYRGRFDGDVLMLSAPMPQGGHSRTSWRLTGPDAHTFLMEVSPDGQVWQPAMEGRYRKGTRRASSKAAKRAKPVAAKSRPVRRPARATKAAAGRSTRKAAGGRKRSAKKARARRR